MTDMTHATSEQLSDFLDEELAPPTRAGVTMHLERCAECAALLTELRRVVSRKWRGAHGSTLGGRGSWSHHRPQGVPAQGSSSRTFPRQRLVLQV